MQNVTAFRFGRSCFGIAVIASGVLQLVTGAFVRLVTTADASLAGPGPGPYLVGGVLVIAGLALVAELCSWTFRVWRASSRHAERRAAIDDQRV